MVAITRTSMINSNNTQINSDYDFSMLRKKILGWESGILKAGDFFLDKNNRRLSAVSPIAEAVILCTRTTSYPIGNQTFYAHFQFTGTIENIAIDEGAKIFIEIKENLILDPSLISDSDGRSDYAKWFWIGEIKIAKSYPSHSNYLPLWEIQGGQAVDKRKVISIPALDQVSQRTATLEAKVQRAEGSISTLQGFTMPQYIGKVAVVWEAYQAGDVMVEKNWRLTKEIYTQRINGVNNLEVRSNKHLLWELAIPQWATITILVKGMGNSWDRFAWRFSIEHKRTGGGLRPDIKYFDLPPRGQKSNGSVEYYEDQGTTLCFYVSGVSETVYATIESIEVTINRNSGLMKFYPREVKGVGERVECTIMGLHSNGDLIQPKPVEIVLGKEMSGTFTTIRDAPNSWYLELTYRTGSRQSQYGWINIWERWLDTSEGNRSERIFVKKWPIVLKWWGREGYSINTYLKLEKFTSVM